MYQHFEDCILIWSIDVHVHICNPDLYKITYSIIMCFKVTISWSSSTHARTHTLAHKCSKLTEKRVYVYYVVCVIVLISIGDRS